MVEQEKLHEYPFNGTVRPLRREDLPSLKVILETWLRDRKTKELETDEVAGVLTAAEESLSGKNDRCYLVAQSQEGEVIGMIGMRSPIAEMLPHAQTSRPTELINAYVAEAHRGGKGVGTALVRELERVAEARGFTELFLNSGPRYENTGYGFYDKLPGYRRVGTIVHMYGIDGDAPVWSKILA